MSAKDRQSQILQIALNEKKLTVSSLSSLLHVTEETIRRDLEKLELDGFITRTFGGAILNDRSQVDLIHFYKRSKEHLEEKQKIARHALPLLVDKATIAVDSSTTVMETIKLLKYRKNLTVLTNSTEVLQELALTDINVVSTGGEFNKSTLSLQGELTKYVIRQYHVDILIMSCRGLDFESGVLDSNENEAEIKKVFLEQASQVALLVDSSKFNHKAFVKLTDWKYVDYIITDKEPSLSWKEFFNAQDIELIFDAN